MIIVLNNVIVCAWNFAEKDSNFHTGYKSLTNGNNGCVNKLFYSNDVIVVTTLYT